MKRLLIRIAIGTLILVAVVVIAFWMLRGYMFVRHEKSYGEYSTRTWVSLTASPNFCGEEIITKTGEWKPVAKITVCEENIQEIRREGDWLVVQMDGICMREVRRDIVTQEEQVHNQNPRCRKNSQ